MQTSPVTPGPRRQPAASACAGPAALALGALLLSGCGGSNDPTVINQLPPGTTPLGMTVYSATAPAAGTSAGTQDLLTGGLGRTGLAAAAAPAYASATAPTALELRRNAIFSNYRGLVDITAAGGFGTFTITAAGVWTYTLNNTNSAVQALNVGNTLTDSFTVTTVDGTAQVVTITISGSNDAAIVSGTATGSVIEAGTASPGTPTATGTPPTPTSCRCRAVASRA